MQYCAKCKQEKSVEQFSWRNKSKGTLQPYCKDCRRAYDKTLWLNSESRRSNIRASNRGWKNRNRQKVREVLKASGCVDCGIKDLRVLEFDHVRGTKINGVMQLINAGQGWATIEAEIDKCVVRCKNCHAIATYSRNELTWA